MGDFLREALGRADEPEPPEGSRAFAYHRALAPILWVVAALSGLEIALTSLLLVHLNPWIGRGVLAVSLLGLAWIIGLIRSLSRRPVLVEPDRVRVRTGLLIDFRVPLADIAEVTAGLDSGDPKRPGFLKASLLAYPNTVITLSQPMTWRRPPKPPRVIRQIGLNLHDPEGFQAAVAAARSVPDAARRPS